MSEKIKKEISKQKFVIAFVVVFIGVLWLGVFYLELTVKKEAPKFFHLQLEKDLCIYLPKECRSNEVKMKFTLLPNRYDRKTDKKQKRKCFKKRGGSLSS